MTRRATPNILHLMSYLKQNSFREEDHGSYLLTPQSMAKVLRDMGPAEQTFIGISPPCVSTLTTKI